MTQLGAWAVTLIFGDGPTYANAIVAPTSEAAVALCAVGIMRENPPKEALTGVAVLPLTLDWMRWASRTIETGAPHNARILNLVQPQRPDWCEEHRIPLPCAPCDARKAQYEQGPPVPPWMAPKDPA